MIQDRILQIEHHIQTGSTQTSNSQFFFIIETLIFQHITEY